MERSPSSLDSSDELSPLRVSGALAHEAMIDEAPGPPPIDRATSDASSLASDRRAASAWNSTNRSFGELRKHAGTILPSVSCSMTPTLLLMATHLTKTLIHLPSHPIHRPSLRKNHRPSSLPPLTAPPPLIYPNLLWLLPPLSAPRSAPTLVSCSLSPCRVSFAPIKEAVSGTRVLYSSTSACVCRTMPQRQSTSYPPLVTGNVQQSHATATIAIFSTHT